MMGLSVSMCVTCTKTRWRPEEDTRFLGTGVTLTLAICCYGFWELNRGPLQE